MPLNIYIDPDFGNNANTGADWANAVETIAGARTKPGWSGGSFQLAAGKSHEGEGSTLHVNVTLQALDYGDTIGTAPSEKATITTSGALAVLLSVSAYKFIANDILFDGNSLLTDRILGRRSDLGFDANRYQEFNRCEFKNAPQYFELAANSVYAPFRLYDCVVRPASTGSLVKLSQCSGIFEDTFFEFNNSPLAAIWMLNGRSFQQAFTRCAFWYSGSSRTFQDSVFLDGLAGSNDVTFTNCSFVNIYSIISSPSNLAKSIANNCIFYNMHSRYISQGSSPSQDAYMGLTYSCWYDSPDVSIPTERTLINSDVGIIEIDPEMINTTTGTLNLGVNSPCIATGDPSVLGNLDGTRSDMGWIDYVGAPKSYPIVDIASSGNNTLEIIEELLIDYEEPDGYIGQ